MNYHNICSISLRPHLPCLIRTRQQSLIKKRAKIDAGGFSLPPPSSVPSLAAQHDSRQVLLVSFSSVSSRLFCSWKCVVVAVCSQCHFSQLLTVSFLTIHKTAKTNIYFSHNHSCSGFFFFFPSRQDEDYDIFSKDLLCNFSL